MKMVKQHFNVTVSVPAVSGDGWSKYPDYSLEETARVLRRALHDSLPVNTTTTVEAVYVEPEEY